MERRSFLVVAGAVVIASASVSQRWFSASAKRLVARPLRPRLKGFARTRALGEAYLWKVRHEPNAEELYQRISRARELEEPANRYERLRTQVEVDFAQGRVVNVGGWFLSETEATLSAVVAMT